MGNYDYLLCHYHKVDSLLWLEIKSWLQQVLKQRVEQSTDTPRVYLSRSMWNSVDSFVMQMETAYLHPRRDSFHVKNCMISYSGFSVPENHFSRRQTFSPSKNLSSRPCHPISKKNQKSTRKEVAA